jgi:hypothetical protein
MRILTCTVLFAAVTFLPPLAAPQASAPGKAASASTAVTPKPSPTPAAPPQLPSLSSAPALTGPKYSPVQMDFGTIDYNASSRRTFLLTAPNSGEITLQIARGAFAAVELRRVPPDQGSKMRAPRVPSGPITPVPSLGGDSSVFYKWNFAAGEEMQLDIVFTPNAVKDTNPGPRTASLDLRGPGNQPWHINIPLRGAVAGPLVQLNPQAGPSAKANKSAATTPSGTSPGTVSALPTPASPPSNAPGKVNALPTPASVGGAALVLNIPVHSPDNFDFGEVWDGDMTRKTFHLTTTAAGYVTVQIPNGPFRVAEFREMGAVQAPSKNPGSKSPVNLGPIQPVKSRITYQDGQSGPFQWSLAPGTDIQIDVAFQPHFNLFTEAAGQKSASMKVTGPGMHGNWTLSVPLLGMFDGLKLSATMAPETKEILAITGEKYVPLNVTLYGLDTPVTGTIRAGSQVPPGVSVMPKSVNVGAKAKLAVTVWLSLGTINAPKDRSPQPLELVFDDGKKTSKAMFQFIGLPGSRTFSSGERNDCVVSHLRLTLTLQAPMHNKITGGFYIANLDDATGDPGTGTYDVQMSMPKGLSLDGYMVGSFMLFAETSGVRVLDQNYWPTYETQNGTEIKKTGPVSGGHGPKQWMQILDGQARFGCQLSRYMNHDPNKIPEVLCGPNYECTKIKWAPMQ